MSPRPAGPINWKQIIIAILTTALALLGGEHVVFPTVKAMLGGGP